MTRMGRLALVTSGLWLLAGCANDPAFSHELSIHVAKRWRRGYSTPLNVRIAQPEGSRFYWIGIIRIDGEGSNRDGFYRYDPELSHMVWLGDGPGVRHALDGVRWFDAGRPFECWKRTDPFYCQVPTGTLQRAGYGPVGFAGEHCIGVSGLRSGRNVVVMSADGPVGGVGIVGFSSPQYLGQVYQQTYDLQESRYVAEAMKLPFPLVDPWVGGCPTPDDRFVLYYTDEPTPRLVWAPTSVHREYPN